jgi:carbon-monoxide dehydrogenase large subunit
MGKYGTGQAIRRIEDQRFLTGTGRYTDDIVLPDQAYIQFFRSPFPHGEIKELDVSEARNVPGVIAVYTADDLTAAGIKDVHGAGSPPSSITPPRPPLQQRPLARDRVRYVGEPVAAVVADNIRTARDAVEQIFLDVEELGAAVTPLQALEDGAPQIHEEYADNVYSILEYGDKGAAEAVFSGAARTVSIDLLNNRLAPTALEPRGCNVRFDNARLTVFQGCQGVHNIRDRLAESLPLEAENIHVICPDVGGGFGLKYFLQCEPVVAAHAAMEIGRPVKWTADRNESFLSDTHGRDHVSHAEMALDDAGKVLGMRVTIKATIGAYTGQVGPIIPWFGACMTTGVYDVPTVYVDVYNVLTNTSPVDAYRGAGRPEAAYLIERLMDKAAAACGLSPDEIRRRNFIAADAFPYRTPTGQSYDSGEYERLMDAALERSDWQGFAARKADSESRGKLRGIGMSYYVEICSGLGEEAAQIRVEENGRITALFGTQATGQGHETSYAQMVADTLGVDMDLVDVVEGDSDKAPAGYGTVGSRSMAIGGSSIVLSAEKLVETGKDMAAELLEAAPVDIEYEAGEFRIAGTDRSVSLSEAGQASYDDSKRPEGVSAGLLTSELFTPDAGTFPNGCHICEVEIDPDTGVTEILRYTVEDDVGVVINPLILEGQIMGGVAQGLGQATGEHAIYDTDTGQLMTATFMDYPMPRADWVPDIDFGYQEIQSPRNPLGVKGAGEAGTVGAAPAYINAVINALASRGIDHIDMPATPHRVWQALNESNA